MRKKQFFLNIITSYGAQLVTTICALILPRLILSAYGSDVNGLVSSITQFLSVVSITDMGIALVVQSSLYKPLADKDNDEISRILVSAQKFYRTIGILLVIYTAVLCIVYPNTVNTGFDWIYVASLIVILSVDSIFQYFFGITKSQLIVSDQKKYITSYSSIIARILNTVVCCALIYMGASIQIVKLVSALVFLINPITYSIYVKRNYSINWKIKYTTEPIKQKWNGVARHITSYIFDNTDTIILTFFSTLANVSVYAVYNMVLKGINQLVSIFGNVIQPMLGEYWAKEEKDKFNHFFSAYEWTMQAGGCFIYGCTMTLIVPFVKVYTNNINDVNYIVPVFAILITLAGAIQFLRLPYGTVIGSVGLYKETQNYYIATSALNIVISLLLVYKFDLVGVAIGTLIASVYMYFSNGQYIYRNILNKPIKDFAIITIKSVLIFIIAGTSCSFIELWETTFISWIILAVIHAIIWLATIILINVLFDREKTIMSLKALVALKK